MNATPNLPGGPDGGSADRAAIADLCEFLDSSPSPGHVVHTVTRRLDAAGFHAVSMSELTRTAPDRGYLHREGAMVAWASPAEHLPDTPMRLVGAHTDSPGLRITPRPDGDRAGWRQLRVEVYGGILANSWLDRDLALAGRVIDRSGQARLVSEPEPIARIPQLAIHLDREINDRGLRLDRHQHLVPVWGIGTSSDGDFARWLAERFDLDGPRWWELCLIDAQPAAVLGSDRSLLASGRLDNQLSCWAATTALVDSTPSNATAIIVFNDHEEVGSASATGASGPLLDQVLELLVRSRGGDRGDLLASLAASQCISADNAHAVHPNYPERHDPSHGPVIGGGPAIKLNANQRYATSPETAARFQLACERAQVPWQVFVSRNDMPCGSTIGPLTATRLGIATADVGVPQLSMHSARELCGTQDPVHLVRAFGAYWSA